jgi:magnesium transporter
VRRARRRSGFGAFLREGRARLRERIALQDSRCPSGCGPGGSLGEGGRLGLVTIFVHRNGRTERATSLERLWLQPAGNAIVWVDLASPSIPEALLLSDTFAFHPLSVEDARQDLHDPKIEAYDGYLYAILHGIHLRPGREGFATHDVDFFIGPTYLVTVHDGEAQSIAELQDHVPKNAKILAEGPVALFHRIVDAMVDGYQPEIERLESRIDEVEKEIFERPSTGVMQQILALKRDVGSLRRIVTPQRDVVARLARRDFVDISTDVSFRFRDVYDHIVRVADDAAIFQDRITGILDAHLTNVSNRLNEVMKVLTVVSTVFLPLTLVSGLWGMNVGLPRFPGGDLAQFWWVGGLMLAIVGVMLLLFRRRRWI